MAKYVRIVNETQGTVLAERCRIADSYWDKMVGLMAVAQLPPGSGLLLVNSSLITMWGMRIPLDIIGFSKGWQVVTVAEDVRPWKFCYWARGAHSVLELPIGCVQSSKTVRGDLLSFEERS